MQRGTIKDTKHSIKESLKIAPISNAFQMDIKN